MQTSNINQHQEAWVRILNKGMITIPKSFRDILGIKEGEVAKMKKVGKKLIIEPREVTDYEVYSNQELQEMIKDDKLPKKLAKITASFWPDLK